MAVGRQACSQAIPSVSPSRVTLFRYRSWSISKVVTGGSLSPRGDWRAPSDGNARVWLDELDANVPDA